MLFIDHENKDGTVAVCDTDDGVIENISRMRCANLQSSGVVILSWSNAQSKLTVAMKLKSVKCFFRKIKVASDDELYAYLKTYSFYPITEVLNKWHTSLDLDRMCRLFNYLETEQYVIVVLGLSNGDTLIVNMCEDLTFVMKVIRGSWFFKTYPSCSGEFFNRRALKRGVSLDLNSEEAYLHMVDRNNRTLFYNEYTDEYVVKELR